MNYEIKYLKYTKTVVKLETFAGAGLTKDGISVEGVSAIS